MFAASFYFGSRYGRSLVKCPQIDSNMVYIQDTTWHQLKDSLIDVIDSLKKYNLRIDTLYMPSDTIYGKIDTLSILNNYYSKFGYPWLKGDSNIIVYGYTTISQNRMVSNELKYKLLKPQTIINNVTIDKSITYNKYLYIGLDIPIYKFNYSEIELLYTFQKGYVGVGYEPQIGGINIKGGIQLLKFKERK